VAAADTRKEARAALENDFPEIKVFASHEEMFKACPTDVVCVSTYAPTHDPIVQDALKVKGIKGLLVEKPLGDISAAGRHIIQSAMEKQIPVVVPHGMRGKATTLEIVKRVLAGDIGELKSIEVQCDKWDLLNAGIHWLDFCLAASGQAPIVSVLAMFDTSTRTYRDGMQVETVGVTYVENNKGVRFIVQTGDYVNVNTAGKGTLFRLVGTKGLIEFWGWENPYYILNAENPSGNMISPKEFPHTAHQGHLDALASQIQKGKADYYLPQGSLMALEIIEAAFLSSKHKCQVKFPLEKFTPPQSMPWDVGKPYGGSGGGRDGRHLPEL
jgi:predicted dehydrogenase